MHKLGGTCSKHERDVCIHYRSTSVKKGPPDRTLHIGQDNIKKDLKVIACGLFNGMNCPHTYGFLFMWSALEND
jgi:hypothetical protein